MNLTCSLLAAYLKYLGDMPDAKRSFRKKVGYFPKEESMIKDVWGKLGLKTESTGLAGQRHPLAFLMEAADELPFVLATLRTHSRDRLSRRETIFSGCKRARRGEDHNCSAQLKELMKLARKRRRRASNHLLFATEHITCFALCCRGT